MTSKYFIFSDVYSFGWKTMKKNLWFFAILGLIWLVIAYTPTFIRLTLFSADEFSLLTFILSRIIFGIIDLLIGTILGIGIIKIALSFCDEQKPFLRMLFDFQDYFWRYLAVSILYFLIVWAGMLLFIVPGIIWAIKFSLCYYFVVDKNLGPIEALKASSRTTNGVKWDLFAFGILNAGIVFIGLLCLVVGIFAAYPTVLVAHTLVYRQLSAQTQLYKFGIMRPSPPIAHPGTLTT